LSLTRNFKIKTSCRGYSFTSNADYSSGLHLDAR
jgi:hypothetical protein